MNKIFPLAIAACVSLLTACSGGSSGDSSNPLAGGNTVADTPTGNTAADFPSGPIGEFPAFRNTFPPSIEIVTVNNYDRTLDTQQVLTQSGILQTASATGTINDEYETFCEASYLPTTATSAEEAYMSLAEGLPETVFGFESDTENLEIFSMNAVVTDGRTGQEFLYRIPTGRGNEITGRGRAFYFNNTVDRLRRSAILYFECFSFTEAFFRNAEAVGSWLDMTEFGPTDTIAAVTRRRAADLPTMEHTSTGESLIHFPITGVR